MRKGSGSIVNCTKLQQTNPPSLKVAHYFIGENNRNTRWRDDSYDDKYYDDETKSLHFPHTMDLNLLLLHMQTLNSLKQCEVHVQIQALIGFST